jgi:hypothetical protein
MKNLRKHIVQIVCCLTLVLVGIGAGAVQAEASGIKIVEKGECGSDVTWRLYSDGMLEIKGDGDMQLGTKTWKDNKKHITEVVIKKGVTSVAPYAFQSCSNLTSVTLPKNLETIGKYAFSNCTKLKTVKLSKGLVTVGEQAFSGCASLKKLTFPASVENINNGVVNGCTDLTDVYIKGSDTVLSTRSFAERNRKKKLYLHGDSNVQKYVDRIALDHLKYKES